MQMILHTLLLAAGATLISAESCADVSTRMHVTHIPAVNRNAIPQNMNLVISYSIGGGAIITTVISGALSKKLYDRNTHIENMQLLAARTSQPIDHKAI